MTVNLSHGLACWNSRQMVLMSNPAKLLILSLVNLTILQIPKFLRQG